MAARQEVFRALRAMVAPMRAATKDMSVHALELSFLFRPDLSLAIVCLSSRAASSLQVPSNPSEYYPSVVCPGR